MVTFGKYKDRPVYELLQDRTYMEWLLNQHWFAGRYPDIHSAVMDVMGYDRTGDIERIIYELGGFDVTVAIAGEGMAVSFTLEGQEYLIGAYGEEFNTQSLLKVMEGIKAIHVWGGDIALLCALRGFRHQKAKARPVQPKEWYEILEVSPYASVTEVKAAFRKKAKETHPDTGGDAETFRKVKEAYEKGCRFAHA